MRVLVTGGTGFIGSHLVHKLIEIGHEVMIVDDFSGSNSTPLAKCIDCRDYEKLDKCFDEFKPEIVYHLAANAAENKAQFSPVDVTSRNYDAFIKTLTAFIKNGGKRFVFTSSIAVYGAKQAPFKEDDKPEPEDLYGITKLAAEQSLEVMSKVHDFEYVIVRPHNVFGPGQNMSDPYRNVVTIWMNAILRKEPLVLYAYGEQQRQFTYIDDLIPQLVYCGFHSNSNAVFNVGTSKITKLHELMNEIIDISGSKPEVKILPLRPQEVMVAYSDHTKIHWMVQGEQTKLHDALVKTWEWCKKQGPQELKRTPIEIDSIKLPSNWK